MLTQLKDTIVELFAMVFMCVIVAIGAVIIPIVYLLAILSAVILLPLAWVFGSMTVRDQRAMK